MNSSERSFEQALEEFLPVSESDRREFLRDAHATIETYGTSAYRHRQRPVAIHLYRGERNGTHLLQSFERMGEGKIDVVIQFSEQPEGSKIDFISRAASKEGSGILSHAEQESAMSPPQLRTGDIAVFKEFVAHPERFVRYNPSDGPSWEKSEERPAE